VTVGEVEVGEIQRNAREHDDQTRPRWPMIVLRSPKGWTGPKVVDGVQVEGTFRSHQVPLLVDVPAPGAVEGQDTFGSGELLAGGRQAQRAGAQLPPRRSG
jgi:phosphoketolase